MRQMLRRRIVVSLVPLALLAGAGGTYAATQSSGNERQAFLADAAKRLNVTPAALSSALAGAVSDRLDAAVAAGRLTRAQADEIKQRMAHGDGVGPLGDPPPFGAHRSGPMLFGGPGGDPRAGGLAAAASYLGLSGAALDRDLRSGKSLAQVAAQQHKTVDGLKQALKTALRSRLDAAVAAKRLTAGQEQAILGQLDARLDAIIQRSGRAPGEGDGPPPLGPRPGRGGDRGSPPPGGPPGPPPF